MFERFTERARKVVVLAQDEARRFGHEYIGTEHLLMGLLREDEGVAAQALSSQSLSPDEVRERVESIVGYGEGTGMQAPFTPRSKKVLELALRESMRLGHNHIGTEHILLGLVREGEGVAARVLSDLDVDPDEIRREVVRRIGGEPESGRPDEVEAETTGNEMLFRGRVGSLRIVARFDGRPETLLADLDYAYAVRDTEDPAGGVSHDDLLAGVIAVLEAQELRSVETGVWRVGDWVLETFPAVREITVSVTDERVIEAHAISAFTVSRTFRR